MKINDVLEDLINFCASRKFQLITITEFQYSGPEFGNVEIVVEMINIKLKIVLDRGQTFLDVWSEQEKSFDRAENLFPELRPLQEKGDWRLVNQLSLIFV